MIPIKRGHQIEAMRVAGRIASEIVQELSAMLQPGVTTGEVDAAAAALIANAGCTSAFLGYHKFPGHICISLNEEVVHGIGSQRKIQYGDIVKIDCGVIKNGWVGDTATTVPVGLVDEKVARLLRVTEAILHDAIQFVRPGKRLGDMCSFIEKQVLENGYSVVREFVGHGVGRKLHEEPQVPNYGRKGSGPKLRPGMILAIEPMVNLGKQGVRILDDGWTVVTDDGQPSAHFEHTVLVTESEPEILTWRERTLSR